MKSNIAILALLTCAYATIICAYCDVDNASSGDKTASYFRHYNLSTKYIKTVVLYIA